MSTFDLLSPSMQKKIWDMGWEHFTPVQEMTIPAVIETDKDVIVSSGTASGKTEAVFLPVLTLVEEEAKEKLKVLYISPLKALINNQFDRIEKLCEHNKISIHRWHGDVDQGKKKKFIKNPTGILQITPESIESLFINRTEYIRSIFKDLEFIIIDEIHSFIDKERGVQLRSLLSRLEGYCTNRPRIIGLSATIDNFKLVREWINHEKPEHVEIIEAKDSDKELHYFLMHFHTGEDRKKPVELYEDLRSLTKENKAIIFCNSRGEVEESTVFLNRLAEREGVGETYYAHHSSIDKKEREYVEQTLATTSTPKSVIATSSLELGIDIGEIELVVQIDSTFTVSSLKQRLGRSGRKKDSNQYLQLYTTNADSLTQSLAVMELVLEKWIEPAEGYALPFDILFHQILSMCHEHNGLTKENMILLIQRNGMFCRLDSNSIDSLLQHMVEKDYLEVIRGTFEYVVGIEGERLMRGKDFYPVFMTNEEYEVVEGAKHIGQLDKDFPVEVGDNIILAGRLWTIQDVDVKRAKIHVKKAVSANPPKYFGGAGKLHPRIAEKMMEILCSKRIFPYINEEGMDALMEHRRNYSLNQITVEQRVLWVNRGSVLFESYTGTKIAKTLIWMLRTYGINARVSDGVNRIEFPISSEIRIDELLNDMAEKEWSPEELLLRVKDNEKFLSKYTNCLPEELQNQMHVEHEMDISGAIDYLKEKNFVIIELQ